MAYFVLDTILNTWLISVNVILPTAVCGETIIFSILGIRTQKPKQAQWQVLSYPAVEGERQALIQVVWLLSLWLKPLQCLPVSLLQALTPLPPPWHYRFNTAYWIIRIRHLGNWPNKERCWKEKKRKKASRHHYKHVILHTHRHTGLLFGVWHVRVMVIKHIIAHHFLPRSAGPFCHLQHPLV